MLKAKNSGDIQVQEKMDFPIQKENKKLPILHPIFHSDAQQIGWLLIHIGGVSSLHYVHWIKC